MSHQLVVVAGPDQGKRFPVAAAGPVVVGRGPVPALPAERLNELSGHTISHYILGPVVARGQSGLLFRAHDTKHKRETAFKVLWPDLARDNAEVLRFVRTMRTIMPLRHPHLVTLYGAGRTRSYCWLAMEYVEG